MRLIIGLAQIGAGVGLLLAFLSGASLAVLLSLVLLSAVLVGFSRMRWHGR